MSDFSCKHFKECGGCALLDLTYPQQVQKKKEHLSALLQDFWAQDIPVTLTDEPRYFRNKVELGFCHQVKWDPNYNKKDPANKTRPLVFEQALGFKLKGKWDRAVDIEECFLFDDKLISLLNAVRAWAQAQNLPYYDQRKHTGILRHFIDRSQVLGNILFLAFL